MENKVKEHDVSYVRNKHREDALKAIVTLCEDALHGKSIVYHSIARIHEVAKTALAADRGEPT